MLQVEPSGGCQRTSPCEYSIRIFQIAKFFGNNNPQVIIPGRADSDLLHKSSS